MSQLLTAMLELELGGAERMRSRGWRRWKVGKGSRSGAIVIEFNSPISVDFHDLLILLYSRN